MAYITLRKIMVDMRASSISCVALNAISISDINLKMLLLKRYLSFCGILMALPENKP
jgi:hypothetical protein|tara:strand:- start:805 stop:975 length:171 start_codon:yes stop_codon:yes gene_type:complete